MNHCTNHRSILLAGFLLLVFLFGLGIAPYRAAQPVLALAPTPPAGPKVVRFAGPGINTTAPEGIVPQVDLHIAGGEYPGCLDTPETPELNYKNDNLELTDIAMIATCGWQPDETVKVTLMDPQGKFFSTTVKAVPARQKKGVYEVDVFFQPGVDAPYGKYRFTLQGSATIKAKVNFLSSKTARMYALPDDRFQPLFRAMGGQQRLRLNGFLPNEPVRLLAYKFDGSRINFYGWQDTTTDRHGQLIVEANVPESSKETEMNYFAYGRDTHFVALERFSPYAVSLTRQFNMDLYCPGAQTSRLSGPSAIRLMAGVDRLDIHQQPGFGSRVVAQVTSSEPLRTFGYPRCIDHAFWWQVSLSKPPVFGWAAESFLGKYLIEVKK